MLVQTESRALGEGVSECVSVPGCTDRGCCQRGGSSRTAAKNSGCHGNRCAAKDALCLGA